MSLDELAYGFMATLYVVAFYNCYRVLGDRLSPSATLAWILVNVLIPVIGVPFYFLLGHNRLRGYIKRHQNLTGLDEPILDRFPRWREQAAQNPTQFGASFAEFLKIFSKFGPIYAAQPGTVLPLVDGANTFEAIFEAIKSAKKYVFVQYYILRHDRLGLELQQLMIEKQRSGVPVFLLYDDMGSFWLSRKYISDLEDVGVQIARYLPVRSFRRFFQMNFRNHRKLVSIDGRVAFTGGLNVGEEYATRYVRKKKSLLYWRDTHAQVTGVAVLKLEEIFLDDWRFATGVSLKTGGFREEAQVIDYSEETANPTATAVSVIPTGPADTQILSILLLMHLINAAKERLWIATPYFIPDPTLLRALELAVLRGVDVRLLLPSEGDYRFVQWVSLSYAELVRSRGVKVVLYTKGFMHQKVIVIDQHTTAIGTMNFDNRALYLNFETTLVVHGRQFNDQMTGIIQDDFVHSVYFAVENKGLRRRLKRLRAGCARLLAPLL